MSIDKESSLLNQKIVYDFTKFTTTDYMGELACIVWHISCNLLCKYCYNDNIVFALQSKFSQNDVLEFLKSRKNLLSAVVLSGGEATMHDLEPFCMEIKKLGFKIKLDTNGINSERIKKLIGKKLIDFISLDFKAPKEKFNEVTQKNSYDSFIKTLKYLIEIKFPFELRTTVNGMLLSENDINTMIEIVFVYGYRGVFYIQNYLQTSSNIGNIKESRVLDKNLIREDLLKLEFRN